MLCPPSEFVIEEECIEECNLSLEPSELYKEIDFFGLFDTIPKFPKKEHPLFQQYCDYVQTQYTKLEIIVKIRTWLGLMSYSEKVQNVTYADPYEFVFTSEKQFGFYFEVMDRFKIENPGRSVFIPSDGLGILSMICILLEISYTSTEPYGLGFVSRAFGIITSSDISLQPQDDDVIVLANLGNYFNLARVVAGRDYVIIDENRFFPGCDLRYGKKSTHYKLFSNVIVYDSFRTAGNMVAHSASMLIDRKVVPLNSKAESYLYDAGIPIYTDGSVVTCTDSILLEPNEDCLYIETSDSNAYKQIEVEEIFNNNPDDIIAKRKRNVVNIITRNYPFRTRIGKLGAIKFISGRQFVVDSNDISVHCEEGLFKLSVDLYSSSLELKNWKFVDGFYVGSSVNMQRVRFLIQDGVKIYLIFLHSFKENGREYGVYRDRRVGVYKNDID